MFRLNCRPNFKLFTQYSSQQLVNHLANSNLALSSRIVKAHYSQKRNQDDAGPEGPPGKVPEVIYIQSPWMWLQNKIYFGFLKLSWDPIFSEVDFKRGTKQAISVMSQLIRKKKMNEIVKFTTVNGFKQIKRDLNLSGNDPRINLLLFENDDIKQTIPVKVHFLQRNDIRQCYVDMFFVALKNLDSILTSSQTNLINDIRRIEVQDKNEQAAAVPVEYSSTGDEPRISKIAFAEIFVRFHRNYDVKNMGPKNWNIEYFKVSQFNILNYRRKK